MGDCFKFFRKGGNSVSKKTRANASNHVKTRWFFSRVLVVGVRILLLPVTLLWGAGTLLWSIPFRVADLRRRAKHPFLCQDALDRFLVGKDPSVGFWDLYCCFRNFRLSRADSFFNAAYTRAAERTYRGVRRAPRGVPKHPAGWFGEKSAHTERRGARIWLNVLTVLPKIFLYVPSRLSASMHRFGRAMENSQTAIGAAARFLRRRGAILVPLALALAVGGVIGYYSTVKLSFAVRVGDETIGYVESRQELLDAIRETENAVSASLGSSFKLPENISYSLSRSINPTYLSKSELVDALSAYTTDYVKVGYALYVDGKLVAASENEGKLRTLLDDALKKAKKKAGKEISLLSDARILYQNCPIEAFLSDEELDDLFSKVKSNKGEASVQLSAYQPTTLPVVKKLSDGQAYCYTIGFSQQKAATQKLSLVYGASRIEEETSPVPFNITYRESDTIYEGAQYVHQKGVAGEKLTTYTVYYSGETEYSREVLSEATLTEPIDQIVLIGTKPLPLFENEEGIVGSQKIFISPVFGEISSHFGLRDMNNDGILESGHSGIDIPATDGTPLYAAGSGVVLEAGDTGNSYGIAVKILHENGLVTYYAHMSAVTVKVGQTVSQNQMIGNVGTTGYVTGAHVHFEVRLPSGGQVNPVNYLIGY